MTDTRISALVIYTDAYSEPFPSRIAADYTLYQRIVGGYIEAVRGHTSTGDQVVFYVNEDGIALGLPTNHTATRLWHRLNPAAEQVLLGNVVVVGADGCDDADVPAEAATLARVVHRDIEIEGFVARIRAAGH
ncbi:MAG: DUF3846 domain-containing protein [Microthrixaceae bacterium]|nr:DUF3846 domain-containing protein [Microthrixaceae bacterium]